MAHIGKRKRSRRSERGIPEYVKKLLAKEESGLIKIDLGCGSNKQPGFIGVDYRKLAGVDIVQDLEQFPWPLPDGCATLVVAGHVVEHINPAKGTFIKFMNEVWRITKFGGQFMISTPYAGSRGYWSDPTHINGCTIETWGFFDPLHPINTYGIYRPLPWAVQPQSTYRVDGNMEILLQKRRIDASYHVDPEYLKLLKGGQNEK